MADTGAIPVTYLDTSPALNEPELVFKMYYAQCLAAGSYIVGHDGWAVVVDPMRDVGDYLRALEENHLKCKAILLTHTHADYVGGHQELADRTGAIIVAGRHAGFDCMSLKATEGEQIILSSSYKVSVMETPGHTPGCCTYVLQRTTLNTPVSLLAFTGDTMFVGSCGRPDLAVGAKGTPQEMASHMYKSLHRVCALGDGVLIFPAHGAGSPCGKALSDKLFSTIGEEKKYNPALLHQSEETFVAWLADSLPTPPQYFAGCVNANKSGAKHLADIIASVPVLKSADFAAQSSGELIIDTREASAYLAGHIKGSVHIPIGEHSGVVLSAVDGNFAIWLGTLVTAKQVFVVTAPGAERECLERFGRVGYAERVAALTTDLSQCSTVSVARLNVENAEQVKQAGVQFVDVRTAQEFGCPKGGHVVGAINLPLQGTMEEFMASAAQLDQSAKYVCLCSGGFRSTVSASLLRRAGLDATDVFGGYQLTISPKLPCMITKGNKRPCSGTGSCNKK